MEKFEDRWAIKQLGEALNIAGEIELDNQVIERLAALAQTIPQQALRCLEAIVKGDREGWGVYAWREHIRTILATALREADLETKTATENLIHYLGSRGYFQFRDLLQSASLEDG
ncbi:MAG: hypothetical protein HYY11_08880 [Candidatus Methylomirabilis oxyfera]|nr:hypothetical protein [Candidatus Methylomirabilis oxyfera]